MVLWIKIGVIDNISHQILKQYQNANIANSLYYGKTLFSDYVNLTCSSIKTSPDFLYTWWTNSN